MILEFIEKGGGMMWVILGISVLAMAIFLGRFFSLFILSNLNSSKFIQQVTRFIEERNYGRALEACNVRTKHPLPKVLKAGIVKSNRREREIEHSMEKEMHAALPHIQSGIGFLRMLANAATLLGLLGTIFGLIRAFSSVSENTAAMRQQILGEGISIAMYTTAFGLIVAIPVIFAHQILSGRADKILVQMEEGASALLAALASRFKDVKNSTPPR